MVSKILKSVITVLFLIYYGILDEVRSQAEDKIYLSNLDTQCLRCLCFAATGCNLTLGCVNGYCGPYKIGRIYWADAGKVILPEDDVDRSGAYEDCALSYQCAQKIIKNYLIKYARDCNNDGRVNCADYSMINFNGGYQCHPPLDRNEAGRKWLERYYSCYPRTPDSD
ncbi:hypothetical protein ILUMI_24972 [Ignelater luminosus]|uniref:lysozyme n=1 Tax=Ignelater luminosus TaxID=2038154 RepID=A0A8K0C9F8_IGNLU|nr:hypothetical protein ILUMI_24972 [Ignelater luminosus]